MESPKRNNKSLGSLLRLGISLTLIGASVLLYMNRQFVIDQLTVWRFEPASDVAAMTKQIGFSQKGLFLLEATRPELLDRSQFNEACKSVQAEQTAVLGCYSGGRTYVFRVNNPKLEGIEEVTAAHEMLHAAYQRLSDAERQRVDSLLSKQTLGEDEARIAELMASYAKTEPGEQSNELHSILGTELETLSPELETYYRQYFVDRARVVRMTQRYQMVFNDLRSRQDALVTTLNNLADKIDAASKVYSRNQSVLNSDIQTFNARVSSGSLTSSEYDSERNRLAGRQQVLRREYDAIQEDVALYTSKKDELSAINSESLALNRSINSSLPEVETIE